nr:hypothetical protein [Deinococcus gobiensis]
MTPKLQEAGLRNRAGVVVLPRDLHDVFPRRRHVWMWQENAPSRFDDEALVKTPEKLLYEVLIRPVVCRTGKCRPRPLPDALQGPVRSMDAARPLPADIVQSFSHEYGQGDHMLQDPGQAEPLPSQGVGHLWRHCGSHRPRDQAIALETAQGERQHALRDAVDAALELSEAFGFR